MKRRSLLLVISLLCMASLMAAMAYSSATVTSKAGMVVQVSHMSLLRIDNVNSPEGDYTVREKDGVMEFDFTQSTGKFGFQRNSVYTYEKLFRIMNEQNRDNGRKSTIAITATTDLPYLTLIDSKGTVLIDKGVSTGKTGVEGYYKVVFEIPGDAPTHWLPKGSNITINSVTSN